MIIYPTRRILKWLAEKGIAITRSGRWYIVPGKRRMQKPRFRRVMSELMAKEGAY